MSFFKDFKEDLSQAVNELLPGEDLAEPGDEQDVVVNTLEEEIDVQSELSKLDGLLEKVSRDANEPAKRSEENVIPERTEAPAQNVEEFASRQPEREAGTETPISVSGGQPEETAVSQETEPKAPELSIMAQLSEPRPEPQTETNGEHVVEEAAQRTEDRIPNSGNELSAEAVENKVEETAQEENKMSDITVDTTVQEAPQTFAKSAEATDEITVITESTTIKGDMSSTGSFDVRGTINGNIECNGKLQVTGTLRGNSRSTEFFADAAKVEGEVISSGTVKIGLGSVIIGNITATSAVIAGAIKGDIDVQGPVVVDTSAVVMGNIKSRSVQINNGAVIEGFCSQSYAEIDVESLFGDTKE
ncbi:MAG: polymer-forming cytoskeletal protein [Lachnospiraceae bacterium]|nr:polymer-forming cytoskeletal protein [Lachnospiraceae bacterium]